MNYLRALLKITGGKFDLEGHASSCQEPVCSIKLANDVLAVLDNTAIDNETLSRALFGVMLEELLRIDDAREQIKLAQRIAHMGQMLLYIAFNVEHIEIVGDQEGLKIYDVADAPRAKTETKH